MADVSGWDYGPGNIQDGLVSPANKAGANVSNGLDGFLNSVGQGFGSILAYGITRAIDDPNQPIGVSNTLPRMKYYNGQAYQGYSNYGTSSIGGGNQLMMLAVIGLAVFLIAKAA